MAGKIFINYRRDDERSAAARVRDRLAAAFGKSNVFMDVDNLMAGQRFDKELEKALAETDIFLAVMGPRWMELFKQRQASGDRDYVREEIAAALKRGIVVIPVLIERAALPRGVDLPDDIRELVLHQKHTVVHEQFGRDVDGLIEAIRFSRKAAAKPLALPKVKASSIGWAAAAGLGLAALAWVGAYTAGLPVPWPWLPSKSVGPQVSDSAPADKARIDAEAKRKADEAEALRNADAAEANKKADAAEAQRIADIKAQVDRDVAAANARLDAEEAAKKRDPALAVKPGSGQSFKDTLADGKPCPMCPEMVVAPSGSFTMGSPSSEERWSGYDGREEPQHKVTIAQPFAVGRFAVTFDEWDACVADGGCKTKAEDNSWGRGRRPVINVSWGDVTKEYLPWLNKKTGKTYRLLSEAEREYVTRAGTTTAFWWGSSISPTQANYAGNTTYGGGAKGEYRQKTMPVDSFEPNPWGLYQVHGNVYDWVVDCWHESYKGAPTDGSAWTTACTDNGLRVVRGGSWNDYPQYLRSANSTEDSTVYRLNSLGFRVGRTLTP